MIDRTALILLYSKPSRHSLNALLAALETDRDLDDLEVRLPAGEAQLEQEVVRALSAGRRPIVGLSFTTPRLWHVRDVLSRVQARRRDGPRVLWIAGGPHPTADPEGTLRLGFDVVVLGEGEATLLDLLKTVVADGDLAGVPGLAFRGPAGQSRRTPRRSPIDLDAFGPFPLRRRRIVGPIEITRGCPFACGFCQTSHLLGMQPRHRSIETIARYAGAIREKSPCDVRVITPNAFSYGSLDGRTPNLAVLESLLAVVRRTLGAAGRLFFGTFPSEVRPEHVNDDALELVKRYADNDYLVIGAQSGSQRVLEHCGRGHNVADVFSAVSRTIAAGLTPHVDFIFGLPGETGEDATSTAEVIRELAAMGALIHAHTFMPLPQTRFAQEPPGRILGHVRPLLKELIRSGTLYGIWCEQEREAKRISRYNRDGRL
jgi:B12-binding domain/radical SAM domain protein